MLLKSYTFFEKSLAWSVHLLTTSGLLAGFMSILAINEKDWREAMMWLVISLVVDGIDGTFARWFKVKEVLPKINGATIDYVIDFATYAIIPAYFFYCANLVEAVWNLPLTLLILTVSALYYGKEGMVSEDYCFMGFPVLWNLAVFYLVFVFAFPKWANALFVVVLSVLHFVPIKIAYPSQASRFKKLSLTVSGLSFIFMPAIIYLYPGRSTLFTGMAIVGLVYFAFLSVYETFWAKERLPESSSAKTNSGLD